MLQSQEPQKKVVIMSSEVSMSDETEKKITKKIAVEVLKVKGKTTLVKYLDGDNLRKVYVPTSKLSKGQVEESVLKKGVPFGLPWDKIELPEITGEQLADELHKRNIWTAEEFRRNPQGVRAAVNSLYGKPLAILTEFVREESSKSVGGK
jgi:hypothetical protein